MNQVAPITDGGILSISVVMAFPIGMGIAALLRWISQTKRGPKGRENVANYWQFLGTFAVPFSLLMAMLKMVARDAQGLEEYLSECALFVSMFFGAWTETRRFQRRR